MTVHLASMMKTAKGPWGITDYSPCGVFAAQDVTIEPDMVTCVRCRRARCWTSALNSIAEARREVMDLKLRVRSD